MKFTEKKAAQLAKKHNVPSATVNTWRHRGRIPEKYSLDDLREASTEQTNELVNALSDRRINRAGLGVLLMKSRDAARGKSRFLLTEYQSYKRALRLLSKNLKEWSRSESGVRKMLSDRRIKKSLVFEKKIVDRSYRPVCFLKTDEINEAAEAMRDLAGWIDSCLI